MPYAGRTAVGTRGGLQGRAVRASVQEPAGAWRACPEGHGSLRCRVELLHSGVEIKLLVLGPSGQEGPTYCSTHIRVSKHGTSLCQGYNDPVRRHQEPSA